MKKQQGKTILFCKVQIINILSILYEDFTDFEDCLQMECAKAYGAEYIVARNISDYNLSDIKAVLPKDYLAIINMER